MSKFDCYKNNYFDIRIYKKNIFKWYKTVQCEAAEEVTGEKS